jgi:hypothetical protein
MKTTNSRHACILLLFLFIGSHLVLTGCSDDSKTSGTSVTISPEAEKVVERRKAAYKAKANAKTRKGESKATKAP